METAYVSISLNPTHSKPISCNDISKPPIPENMENYFIDGERADMDRAIPTHCYFFTMKRVTGRECVKKRAASVQAHCGFSRLCRVWLSRVGRTAPRTPCCRYSTYLP